ncbi:conserved oligomeric Golgi complex subunit 2 [Plakobranchus ocellatus]|uniref:Conserved oligomeric Golgi complex subunit 2 n=1 Tax=Plakobranchus ocellatus TaxID=259542 RepID=A0AAV4CCE2_9GAST|nr:conserved oligomeric Golgi complex subunit 2 [Plakobranchus ocellatus]
MLWRCLVQCWDEEIYLQALLHRFVKLNIQLLSRFKTWLDEIYQEEVSRKTETMSDTKQRSSTPDRLRNSPSTDASARSTSPVFKASSSSTTETSVQQQPITLGQIVTLMADIENLSQKVSQMFDFHIKPKLVIIGFEKPESVEESLTACVSAICECCPRFWAMVTEDIVKQCSGFLTQVNDIPRLYRRTNKEVPSKPSAYLAGVIKPLSRFCEEHTSLLSEQQKQEFLSQVFSALTQQFCEVTSEVLVSTKKMEDSLRRLKKARGTDKDKEKAGVVTDSDKIRTQIIIDIDSFNSQMETLGLKVTDAEGYSKLEALSKDAKADMTSVS